MKNELVNLGINDQAIAVLRDEYKATPDASTKEGYKDVKEGISKLRKLWVSVTKEADEQKKQALLHQRNVNSEKDRVVNALKDIANPLIEAKKDVDEAEEREKESHALIERERINEIIQRIDDIRLMGNVYNLKSLSGLEERRINTIEIKIDGSFEEFEDQALGVKTKALEMINEALTEKRALREQEKKNEEMAKELEAKKKDQDRIDVLKVQIARIQSLPFDLMGAEPDKLELTLVTLKEVKPEDYEEFEDIVRQTVADVWNKINAMMEQAKEIAEQQEKMENEQAELNKQRLEQDKRHLEEEKKVEKLRLDKEKKKQAKTLANRLPEDQKMRGYADALMAVDQPAVKDPVMAELLHEVEIRINDIHEAVYKSTQDIEPLKAVK